jgi:hypothetical protein
MKKAFYYLWFAGLNRVQAIEAIQANLEVDASIQELIDFMQSSKRGVISGVSRRQQDEKPVDSASESEPALV